MSPSKLTGNLASWPMAEAERVNPLCTSWLHPSPTAASKLVPPRSTAHYDLNVRRNVGLLEVAAVVQVNYCFLFVVGNALVWDELNGVRTYRSGAFVEWWSCRLHS
ncbi:hypothetical protein C8J57DRAFT_1248498 [Mycena rebaudengoi]|nr:hypothetical protein C8J57DRAFT_1248498 [Mycena rebaudengoi]